MTPEEQRDAEEKQLKDRERAAQFALMPVDGTTTSTSPLPPTTALRKQAQSQSPGQAKSEQKQKHKRPGAVSVHGNGSNKLDTSRTPPSSFAASLSSFSAYSTTAEATNENPVTMMRSKSDHVASKKRPIQQPPLRSRTTHHFQQQQQQKQLGRSSHSSTPNDKVLPFPTETNDRNKNLSNHTNSSSNNTSFTGNNAMEYSAGGGSLHSIQLWTDPKYRSSDHSDEHLNEDMDQDQDNYASFASFSYVPTGSSSYLNAASTAGGTTSARERNQHQQLSSSMNTLSSIQSEELSRAQYQAVHMALNHIPMEEEEEGREDVENDNGGTPRNPNDIPKTSTIKKSWQEQENQRLKEHARMERYTSSDSSGNQFDFASIDDDDVDDGDNDDKINYGIKPDMNIQEETGTISASAKPAAHLDRNVSIGTENRQFSATATTSTQQQSQLNPPSTPGALAVTDGTAQRLAKPSLHQTIFPFPTASTPTASTPTVSPNETIEDVIHPLRSTSVSISSSSTQEPESFLPPISTHSQSSGQSITSNTPRDALHESAISIDHISRNHPEITDATVVYAATLSPAFQDTNDEDYHEDVVDPNSIKVLPTQTSLFSGRKKWLIIGGISVLLLIIIIGVAIAIVLALDDNSNGPKTNIVNEEGNGDVPPEFSMSLEPTPTPQESVRMIAFRKSLIEQSIVSMTQLDDSRSSQFQALEWIANFDTIFTSDEDSFSDILLTRYALAVFYFNLDGPTWDLQFSNANDDDARFLNPFADVCDWTFITCDTGSVDSIRVTRLFGLRGNIPTELNLLPFLNEITIQSNEIQGIDGPIFNLKNLDLASNTIGERSRDIPSAIYQMTKLENLSLRSNNILGTVSSDIQQLTSLVNIDLSRNRFQGILPSFSGLSEIRDLVLDENNLEGNIMDTLDQLPFTLRAFWGQGNSFSGSITNEINRFSNLARFQVSRNNLSGTLPNTLFNISTLAVLDLSDNAFSGTIGAEIGNGIELERLSLNGNQISGSIPTEIGRLIGLFDLDIENNALNGTIPSELGMCFSLVEHLKLGFNSLSGSIPSELGNLRLLRRLYLETNELTGSVPFQLGNMEALFELRITFNSFSGIIPSEVCSISSLFQIQASTGNSVDCGDCNKCV